MIIGESSFPSVQTQESSYIQCGTTSLEHARGSVDTHYHDQEHEHTPAFKDWVAGLC